MLRTRLQSGEASAVCMALLAFFQCERASVPLIGLCFMYLSHECLSGRVSVSVGESVCLSLSVPCMCVFF